MTCHDARERFSALVDDMLAAGERAALDAHLATCADCRRELQRFRDTVALVRAVAPVRAPAGFVDRVLDAARPVPWPRRLVRGLFLPWPVKLPMEAAAIVLVAVGVGLVYRGAPDLQQLADVDSIAQDVRQSEESAAPPALASKAAREADALRERYSERELRRAKDQAQSFAKAPEATGAPPPPKVAAPAETVDQKLAAAPPPTTAQPSAALSRDAEPQQTPERREKQEPQVGGKLDAPPALADRPEAMTRERSLRSQPSPTPRARADAVAPSAPLVTGSSLASGPSDVAGRLVVSDRDVALRGVAELVTRLGAIENRRAEAAAGQILELTVPRDAYAEFMRELARLGRWQPSKEPPALPAQVRVVLYITP
jgi:Putative zinc-finger